MVRLVVVSDTHLSPARPDADRNWEAVLAHVQADPPDLVLHAGDLTDRGSDVELHLSHARDQLDRLPVPWKAVPGNHDLGNPVPERELVERRRARFEEIVGPRFWSVNLAGWRLVGVDAQTLQSGDPGDERWWGWTAEHFGGDRPVLVLLHRPVAPIASDEPDSHRRYLVTPHRQRFRALLEAGSVRAVVSGHAHQWRTLMVDGRRWVWVPSTWAVTPDDVQPSIGSKQVGVVEIDLDGPDDAVEHEHWARLVRPAGMGLNRTGPTGASRGPGRGR